ncbi:outer membrane protein assembly factor BamB family protein [Spirosoma areae]
MKKHINIVLMGAGLLVLTVVFLFINAFTEKKEGLDENWGHYGHDATNNKYSDLAYINVNNVINLKEIWHHQETQEGSSIFFNPLVVNGKMIALLPSKKLVALNAANGELIWEFIPDNTYIANWSKSVTYHAGKNGKPDVVLFISGGTLYAVNAQDGKLIDEFGKQGRVDFYTGLSVADSMRSRVHVTSNAPGVIYEDLFIVGCKVPDELPSTSGDIRAFNVFTGKLVWVFHTIPQKGEFGAETWAANAREKNGGANCWGGMALDQKRGIVYVPTASPSFDFYGADRPGKNLFANCLLALDAKTGKRIWHFQTTHHDLWDRDNGSPPNLVTINQGGKQVDAVALVTKMGYLFLFDRFTGKSLFPINEVAVSTKSTMPGEKPWPTQPIPTKPAPFARQGYKEEYFSNLTPESERDIKKQIAENKYNTGIYEPPSLNGSIILPAANGGANWGGASVNPKTGILFVNSTDLPWFLKLTELKKIKENNNLSGENLFKMYCSSCHGVDRKGTNYGPNILAKTTSYNVQKLENIIRKGAEPMPSFRHLPQEQISAIIGFLKGQQIGLSAGKRARYEESNEPYGFSGYDSYTDGNGNPTIKPPFGTLNAIDLNTGNTLWQVPLGEDPKLAKMGIKQSGIYNRGGGIATAGGLIFIAATVDRTFRAFDQKTGEILWQVQLPGNGTCIPATYALAGKQYITLAVSPNPSTGYKGGYLTFGLN